MNNHPHYNPLVLRNAPICEALPLFGNVVYPVCLESKLLVNGACRQAQMASHRSSCPSHSDLAQCPDLAPAVAKCLAQVMVAFIKEFGIYGHQLWGDVFENEPWSHTVYSPCPLKAPLLGGTGNYCVAFHIWAGWRNCTPHEQEWLVVGQTCSQNLNG